MHGVKAGYVECGELPGLVTLVSRRDEVPVDAIGMKAVGGSDAMRRDTIFRIASMYSDPTEDMVAILMTQSFSTLFSNLYPDFWTSVYQAIDD